MNLESEQKDKLENVETTSYEAWLSLLDVVMLYRSMLIRVTKRYSAKEVSFLMGEKLSYIGEMEQLQHVNFRMNIIWKKHFMIHTEGAATLFPSYPVGDGMGNFQLVKTVYPDRILYQVNQRYHDGTIETLFLLWDDTHAVDPYPDETEEERKSLYTAIQALVDLNYFKEERSPYEVFLKCQSLIYNHIKPINLYQVLNRFIKQKGYPKLKQVKTKYSGYKYVAGKSQEHEKQ